MDSMPLLDDDFNYNEINLDFLVSPPRLKANSTTIASNQCENNLEPTTFHDNIKNFTATEIKSNVHEEINTNKALNLDFLESPKKEKTNDFVFELLTQDTCAADVNIKTEKQSIRTLAKRIAKVDTLVRQLQAAEEANTVLTKQMEDFNKSAKEIQVLYNSERNARIEAEAQCKTFKEQCDHLETELAAKTLELDQVHAQMEDCNGPVSYSELAIRFLKLAQKLDEERQLHWHDQPLFKDIVKYCKDKNIKVPKITPRSPPKRKSNVVRKNDAEVQCELLTEPLKIDTPKIQQRHQSTQCLRAETRSQGCQHIGTTTTRGTTTSCFFKYHDVGTSCTPNDWEPAFNDILEEMRNFGDRFAALSPIADILDEHETLPIEPISSISPILEIAEITTESLPKTNCSIGVNTDPQSAAERKTVGSCTYICNVQRPLDFMAQQPPICIKRSDSRPPSRTLTFEAVKDELNSRSSSSSPINFNLNSMNNVLPPLAPPATSSSTILPNAFDELWQIFGHMLYGLLNRRLNIAGATSNASTATPHNITNQQNFYNWLHAIYNNAQATQADASNQSTNLSEPMASHQDMNLFSNSHHEPGASINHPTPHLPTPLSFSDTAPTSRTVPNVIKPAAVRNSLVDSNTNQEPSACSTISCNRKSTATSPIRCLNSAAAKPKNASDSHRTHNQEASTTAAISATKTNKLQKLDKKSHLIKKPKRFKLQKCRLQKSMAENAVEFLAKLPPKQKEIECQTAIKNKNTESSDSDYEALQKQKSCNRKLQQLNYTIFGSDSETDNEMEREVQTETGNCSDSSSTTNSSNNVDMSEREVDLNSSSCKNTSNQSSASDEDERDEQPLQIVEDFLEESNEKQRFETENLNTTELTNEYLPIKVNLSESSFKTDFEPIKISETRECVTPHTETLNSEAPKKRGRKRKIETGSLPTTPKLSPCKRSARLLAKQINKPQAQSKKLSLLTLDFNNSSSKQSKTLTEINALNNKPSKDSIASKTSETKTSSNSTELLKSTNQSSTVSTVLTLNLLKQPKASAVDSTINISNSATAMSTTITNMKLRTANTSPLLTSPYALQNAAKMMDASLNSEVLSSSILANRNSSAQVPTQKPACSTLNLVYPQQAGKHTSNLSSKVLFYTSKINTKDTAATKTFPTTGSTKETTLKPTDKPTLNVVNLETSPPAESSKDSEHNDFEGETLINTTPNGFDFQALDNNPSTGNTTVTCSTKILNSPKTSNASPASPIPLEIETTSSSTDQNPNTFVSFNSPPASPIPFENEQTENVVKEIPLELSVSHFPTWRRWRQHQRSLMHNLISAYDSKLYQGFKASNELSEFESTKVQQMAAHINEYLKQTMELQANLTFPSMELAVSQTKQKLQEITVEHKLLAQAILASMQKQQRPITTSYEQYVNGTPTNATPNSVASIHDSLTNQAFSTHAHRCCSYLLRRLTSEILTALLQQLENTLFDIKNADSLPLYDALNLTDLYLLTLSIKPNSTCVANPARLFIGKCLYYHKLKAAPMIYAVLCAFPTVLPHREERRYDRSDALITVIQHCLMCNLYDMNNSELLQRELLSKLRFQYHFECFKPDFNDVLTNLVEKLCAGKVEHLKFAFAILCKRLPPDRVVRDVLQQHFMPLANEYYRLTEQNAAYEARLATLLDCFSTVIKPFPRDPTAPHAVSTQDILSYLNFFKRFLTMTARPLVQEAAVHAILRLQRFDFLNCYQALAHLRIEFEMQPNTRAALKTFVYRKPLSFWKALMLQNS